MLEDLIEVVDEDQPAKETALDELVDTADEEPEVVAEGEADRLIDEQAPTYLVCQVCELDNLPDAAYCRLCGAVVALARRALPGL